MLSHLLMAWLYAATDASAIAKQPCEPAAVRLTHDAGAKRYRFETLNGYVAARNERTGWVVVSRPGSAGYVRFNMDPNRGRVSTASDTGSVFVKKQCGTTTLVVYPTAGRPCSDTRMLSFARR